MKCNAFKSKLAMLMTALAMMTSIAAHGHAAFPTADVEPIEQLPATYPPSFPGGDAELIRFLATNLRYPDEAKRDSIEGKVIVQFTVKKSGKIGGIKVLRSVDKALDKEAVRVVKMMPKFNPGFENGVPADMLYTVPVTFKLFDEYAPLAGERAFDPNDVDAEDFEEPQFPGGEMALMNFLRQNIRYPEKAAKKNIQGRVVVTFVVEKSGKVTNIKVAQSVDFYLDTEAMRVCARLPKFIPGKINGEPVAVWFTLPVTFRLNE